VKALIKRTQQPRETKRLPDNHSFIPGFAEGTGDELKELDIKLDVLRKSFLEMAFGG
jgi:hypothetical protein